MEGLDGKYVDIGASGFTLIFLLAFAVCVVTYYFLRKRVKRKTIVILLILFLAGYAFSLFIFLKNPLIYGIDGPWYVTQVRNIVEYGVPKEEGVEPLVLYFASGCAIFVGDVTLGIKITQAFLSALPILTVWPLAFYITKNNFASFVMVLFLTISAVGIGASSQIIRNAGALAFLPLFYLFFFKFINREGREWSIKTPFKIRGRKLGLTLNSNLVLSIIIFGVISGCHYLTAGFAFMTIIAYIAFFTGYRRKMLWKELKFVIVLGIIMLTGMVVSSGFRDKVLDAADIIATSDPVPPDLFPFSEPTMSPVGNIFILFAPFILLAIPAMWFTFRNKDRKYLLFTTTVFLSLLCSQNWVLNSAYSCRLMLMFYLALFILVGISIWHIRKHFRKMAVLILVGGICSSFFMLAGVEAIARPWFSEEDLAELGLMGQQLTVDSTVMTPGVEGPGGLPAYPGANDLHMSKENIEENFFQGRLDLSPPEISAAVYSTTASYSEILDWYRIQMPAQGWTEYLEMENQVEYWYALVYSKESRLSLILIRYDTPDIRFFALVKYSPGVEEPEATSEIRFNSNPLFAFILLPIELVQGLYGTAVYGVLKLVIAIPLSIGLIGLLMGLIVVLARRLKHEKSSTVKRKT